MNHTWTQQEFNDCITNNNLPTFFENDTFNGIDFNFTCPISGREGSYLICKNVVFYSCTILDCVFGHITLRNTIFRCCHLEGNNFIKTCFYRNTLNNSFFIGNYIFEAEFKNCLIIDCTLGILHPGDAFVDFEGCYFRGTTFYGKDNNKDFYFLQSVLDGCTLHNMCQNDSFKTSIFKEFNDPLIPDVPNLEQR